MDQESSIMIHETWHFPIRWEDVTLRFFFLSRDKLQVCLRGWRWGGLYSKALLSLALEMQHA